MKWKNNMYPHSWLELNCLYACIQHCDDVTEGSISYWGWDVGRGGTDRSSGLLKICNLKFIPSSWSSTACCSLSVTRVLSSHLELCACYALFMPCCATTGTPGCWSRCHTPLFFKKNHSAKNKNIRTTMSLLLWADRTCLKSKVWSVHLCTNLPNIS